MKTWAFGVLIGKSLSLLQIIERLLVLTPSYPPEGEDLDNLFVILVNSMNGYNLEIRSTTELLDG